ncbi:MAG: response regulator, partial [Desulfobacterales bacterium]|nr:response regulator [Desulfobacterales bacterium]
SVKDTGIGISKEDMGRLFIPFTQVDNTNSRKYGGTGLGLSISKKLTEMMGGEIWAESIPEKGSVFNFTARFGLQMTKDKAIYPDFQEIKILVVDDNFTLRETMISILKSFNILADSAVSGEDALQKLTINERENRAYSLLLIDWMMPDMDGVELSERIKGNPIFRNIPIIIMTALGLEKIQLRASKAGVNSFLIKPIKRFVLLETIMKLFGKKIEVQIYKKEKSEITDNSNQKFKGLKILLVDDNSMNQQVAREMLQFEGIIVIVASNGREAVDLVNKDFFDIVFMDLEMPVMDGYEATRLIRKDITITLPIIAMTGHALDGYREKCMEAGMNDYITKPIEFEELFETIDRWSKPKEKEIPLINNEVLDETLDIEFPQTIAGIDIESGIKRIFGNKKKFIKLLYEFHTNFGKVAQNIRKNLDEGDTRNCQQIVHSIQGVAGNIGANDLHKIAGELEIAFKKQEIKNINALLDNFEKKLNLIIEYIAELKKNKILEDKDESADNEDIPVNTSRVSLLLDKLAYLLQIGDSEAGNILTEIKDCLKGSTFKSYVNQLEEQIYNFNFNEAQKTLIDLANFLRQIK